MATTPEQSHEPDLNGLEEDAAKLNDLLDRWHAEGTVEEHTWGRDDFLAYMERDRAAKR